MSRVIDAEHCILLTYTISSSVHLKLDRTEHTSSFSEVWPRAAVAKSEIARFAHGVLTKPDVCVDSTGIELPRITCNPVPQQEYDLPFNNETWMENLIQEEELLLDPTKAEALDFVMAQLMT
ncbi:hypothetical protein PV11_01083 [Exophiala sideris]|uniref:Uncharacterized protein n=1 Tax=Exophiala sideris TaxID=1016849 RepID=A0A0D1W977_9EURO|nr:hypothetical protein PV11_01083 [Exophiala sideris]